MSGAIEVQLKSIITRSTVSRGTETQMVLLIQPDDVPKIEPLRNLINERFAIALAGPITNDESQPAQEGRQRHVAARSQALNGYAQRAVILCNELEFAEFLTDDFPNRNWGTTRTAVLELIEVNSRKEIIEGTPAGDRWEHLMDRFAKWKQQRVPDQLRNG